MVNNINEWEQAFLFYSLQDDIWLAYETLPENYSLTAGEEDNDYAFVDISHWTQYDLDLFDSADSGERLSIVESLEFSEFAKEVK